MADVPKAGIGRRLSVVLPAYNEQDNIEKQVRSVDDVLREMQFDDYEILVVDDGSRDRTRAVAEALRADVPKLKVLVHEVNQGYAKALRTGFTGAAMPLVFYTDADNQFDVHELKNLLPSIDDYDIVSGFRIYRFDPFSRLVLSWGYNLIVRILFRIRVRDVDCAFKLFRREIFDQIHIESKKFFVDTEILAKASKLGLKMTEIGVRHYPRTAGESTVRPSHVIHTLAEIAQMWRDIYIRGKDLTPAFRTVLLASAVLKIGLALLVGETAPRYDETEYVEFGRAIWEQGAEPRLWRAPMQQWIVAGGMALTGGKLVGGRLIGAVLSVLTTWLVYRAARRVAGERAAFWAATSLAFYPSHVAFSHWFWSETLYLFFTALALERLLAADGVGVGDASGGGRAAATGRGAITAAAVAGAALGGAALSRSLGLVMLAVAAAWLTLGRGRRGLQLAAVAALAAVVVVAPYSLRATQRAGTVVLTDVNGPFNFWSGNNRYIPSDLGMIWALGLPLENGLAPRFLAYYPDDAFRREVPMRLGEAGVTDAQGPDGAAWYRREAWESITEDPLGVLRRAPRKLAALWGPDMFLPRHLLRDWYGELPPGLAGGLTIVTWLAAAVALIGGAAAMAALRPSRFRSLAWGWTAAYLVLHAVAYGHTRMHQPLIPLLLIALFAFFLDRHDAPDRARLLRRGAPAAALAVAAWVTVWPLLGGLYVYPGPRHAGMARFLALGHELPLPGTQRQVWSLATVEASLGRNQEALRLLDRSRHGDLAWSWMLRALMTERVDDARRFVDRALEREPYLEPAEILKRQLERAPAP